MKLLFVVFVLLCVQWVSVVIIEIDSLDWKLKKENDDIWVLIVMVLELEYWVYLVVIVVDVYVDDLVVIIRNL